MGTRIRIGVWMWGWREGRRGEYGSVETVLVFAVDGSMETLVVFAIDGFAGLWLAAWHWR